MTPARVLPIRGDVASDDTRGAVVTVIGPPKSGKSSLLWQWYARHEPRILSIDVVGEARKRDPNALETFGLDDTLEQLRDVVGRKLERWHVAASLERDELEALFWKLCPHRTSSTTLGFGKAVGGLTVFCDELLALAPNGLKSSRVKVAYLQYRHHWLTILGATQYAPDVDPCTRAGDRLVALRTVEDLAVQAIARATSKAIGARVAELEQYHSITCIKDQGRAYIADAEHVVYQVIDYRGRSLSSAAAPLTAGLSPAAARSASADVPEARPAARHRQARA